MEKKYSLLSENEPTDLQLQNLMKEVLKDVKSGAEIATENFNKLQALQISEALHKYHSSKLKNA